MTPFWPIRVHVHPALALLALAILAVVWHIARRTIGMGPAPSLTAAVPPEGEPRSIVARASSSIDPENGVQPWDPRTVGLTSNILTYPSVTVGDNLTTADNPPIWFGPGWRDGDALN